MNDRKRRDGLSTEGTAQLHCPDDRQPGRTSEASVGHRDRGPTIDINSATEDELRSLPGIGPATARRLVEGRPYGSVDDLLRVDGIGRSKLSQIRSFVALG